MVIASVYNNQQMNNSYQGHNFANNALPFYNNFSSYMPPFDIHASHPQYLQSRMAEPFNQKQMKQIVEQIRFKQKMQVINKKKGKYKRSTNNCHKKYIGILKNLLFLKLENAAKDQLVTNYFQYRNSRVYYFIILSYIKWYLSIDDIRWVYQHFCKEVEGKLTRYKLEISTTNNSNFVHFRKDQIVEMDYSIQAINLFLKGEEEEPIRLLYQKNKYIIIKKNQYLKTLEIVRQLRMQLETKFQSTDLEQKLSDLKLDEVYQWKKEDTDKYINYNHLSNERQKNVDSRSEDMNPLKRLSKKSQIEMQENSQSQNQAEEKPHRNQVNPSDSEKIEPYKIKKEELLPQEAIKKYPLVALETSYPTIDFITWHTWQLHKQKKFEFQMKLRDLINCKITPIFNQLPVEND